MDITEYKHNKVKKYYPISFLHKDGKEKNVENETTIFFLRLKKKGGSLGGAAVWYLPLAQGAILETLD